MAFETIKQEIIHKGKIFDVYKDTVNLPDGRTAEYDMIYHNGAVCVLPIDSDGKMIFVKQFRQAAKDYVIEIPAGRLEEGEEPVSAAKRELEEETSYKAGKMTFLYMMYIAVGYSTEKIYLYVAEDLAEGKLNLDEDEFVEVIRMTPEEAVAMIKSNEICDSKTIAAVMTYVAERK